MSYSYSNPVVATRDDFMAAAFVYQEACTSFRDTHTAQIYYEAMQAYVLDMGRVDPDSQREFTQLALARPNFLGRMGGDPSAILTTTAISDVQALRADRARPLGPDQLQVRPIEPVGTLLRQAQPSSISQDPSHAFVSQAVDSLASEPTPSEEKRGQTSSTGVQPTHPDVAREGVELENQPPIHFNKKAVNVSLGRSLMAGATDGLAKAQGRTSVGYPLRTIESAYWLTPYQKWVLRSFGNALVVTLRSLQTGEITFPLKPHERVFLERLMEHLTKHGEKETFRYRLVTHQVRALFQSALQETDQDAFDILRVGVLELLDSPEMQTIKRLELQDALIPIMSYLDGKEMPSGQTIEASIEQALTVFRRWGWIEPGGEWREQGDTAQLLETLSQWLIENKWLADEGLFVSRAQMEQDSSLWQLDKVNATDERDLIRNAYKARHEPAPKDLQDDIRRAVYIQSILSRLPSEHPLQGLLTTCAERRNAFYEPEPVKFYGFGVVSAEGGQLVPEASLDRAILAHTFAGVDRLPAFDAVEDSGIFRLVKYQIPMHSPVQSYQGKAPKTIFLTRTSQLVPRSFLIQADQSTAQQEPARAPDDEGIELHASTTSEKAGDRQVIRQEADLGDSGDSSVVDIKLPELPAFISEEGISDKPAPTSIPRVPTMPSSPSLISVRAFQVGNEPSEKAPASSIAELSELPTRVSVDLQDDGVKNLLAPGGADFDAAGATVLGNSSGDDMVAQLRHLVETGAEPNYNPQSVAQNPSQPDWVATHPKIEVAPKVSFHGRTYILTRILFKSGNQHAGHYASCFAKEGKTLLCDSLKNELEELEHPLHEVPSLYEGAVAFCYSLEGSEASFPQGNLRQAEGSNSCYVLQAIEFMWKNSLFAAINGMEPLDAEGRLEESGPEWQELVQVFLTAEGDSRMPRQKSPPPPLWNPSLGNVLRVKHEERWPLNETMPGLQSSYPPNSAFRPFHSERAPPMAPVLERVSGDVGPRYWNVGDLPPYHSSSHQMGSILPSGTRTSPSLKIDGVNERNALSFVQYRNARSALESHNLHQAFLIAKAMLQQKPQTPYQILLMQELVDLLKVHSDFEELRTRFHTQLNQVIYGYKEPNALILAAISTRYDLTEAMKLLDQLSFEDTENQLSKLREEYEAWKATMERSFTFTSEAQEV